MPPKNFLLRVRLSEPERHILEEKAGRQGLSLSEYIRSRALHSGSWEESRMREAAQHLEAALRLIRATL